MTLGMRILVLSNFYPPARSGGYTQWCQEVAERLCLRGHTVGVLTSDYERAKVPASEHNIYRLLHLEGDLEYYQPLRFFTEYARQLRTNLVLLEQVLKSFTPDLVFVWGMWALTRALPARAEELLPGRVVYYLSDYWPSALDMHTIYWRATTRHIVMRPIKRALGVLAMSQLHRIGCTRPIFEHAMCVSARVRDLLVEAGVPVQHAHIVHGGTDVGRFSDRPRHDNETGRLRLLYIGQLVWHKGVHTAIEALAHLSIGGRASQADLTIVGSGHPDYEASLRQLVDKHCLQEIVHFHGSVPREVVPAMMAGFEVLVFPSIYEEPLARVTQEAMLAGLVVIGTITGGTGEMLQDGVTGLAFAPQDSAGLAKQLVRMIEEPALKHRLSAAGRQHILDNFSLDRMVQGIEDYLLGVRLASQDAKASIRSSSPCES